MAPAALALVLELSENGLNGFGPSSASCTAYRSNAVLMNAVEVLEQRKPI